MPQGRSELFERRDHENLRFSNDQTPLMKPTIRDSNDYAATY